MNAAAAKLQVRPQRTPQVWHVVAEAQAITGRTGTTRIVLRVPRCPWCAKSHLHHGGQRQAEPARRRAACGLGCYVIEMRGVVA